jgi:zinc protease
MSLESRRPGSATPPRWLRARSIRHAFVGIVVVAITTTASAQLPAPARPSQGTPSTGGSVSDAVAVKGLPSARSILDRHVEAIGGRRAVLAHKSIYVKGSLTMPAAGIGGTVEVYSAAPNKLLMKVAIDGVGEVAEGFDGTHAWSMSPMTGPMLQEGKALEQKRLDAEFHGELHPDSRYVSMITEERTEFDGRPCYKVRLVRKIGGEDFEFYDVATGLKAGSITTRETPMGSITSTSIETDYKKFGDLLHAATLKQQIGPVQQIMTVAAVEYDTVEPAVFDLPPAIKALVK